MTTLTEFTLNEEDKLRLEKLHDKNVSNSLRNSFSHVASTIYSNLGSDIPKLLYETVAVTGSTALNYERQIQSYHDELDSELWMLKKEEIRDINELRVYFLDTSWKLMSKYSIPDEWRLTEEQINDFLYAVKLDDYPRSERVLSRMEGKFYAYPPFWFYKGSVLAQQNKYEQAIEEFNNYENKRIGFLRNDQLFSSSLMQKIEINELLDLNIDMDDIEKIIIQSPKDWQKVLYSSLKYWSFNEFEKALETVQINIDNGTEISLNKRVKASITASSSPNEYEQLVLNLINDDIVKNNDILFLIGEKSTSRIISEFEHQINTINMVLSGSMISTALYNRDKIFLDVPYKWIYDGSDIKETVLHYNNSKIENTKVSILDEEKIVRIQFESPVVFNLLIEKKEESDLYVDLPGVNGGVTMFWKLKIEESLIDKNIKDSLVDKTSKVIESSNRFIGRITENEDAPVSLDNNSSGQKIEYLLKPELKWINTGNYCFLNSNGSLSIAENSCEIIKELDE